jgi:hypothetical protein
MKIVPLLSAKEIHQKFEEMRVDPMAIEIMLDKFQFLIIEVERVRNYQANIIKQEMLVIGGEAAVDQETISCKVEYTPMLLSGTKKTFRKLLERLRHYNNEELNSFVDDLAEALAKS